MCGLSHAQTQVRVTFVEDGGHSGGGGGTFQLLVLDGDGGWGGWEHRCAHCGKIH